VIVEAGDLTQCEFLYMLSNSLGCYLG